MYRQPRERPMVFMLNSTTYIVGTDWTETKGCYVLTNPASVRTNDSQTGFVFTPMPLIEPGEQFAAEKTALFGKFPMPRIMHADFAEYVRQKAEEVEQRTTKSTGRTSPNRPA